MIMAPTHLKIICLNIEKNTHLNRVLSFFNRERPDVVLLQEVLERDIPLLESLK
jgi:exonuclease III